MAQQVMNSNIIHEERDWIPGLTLLSKDPDFQGGALMLVSDSAHILHCHDGFHFLISEHPYDSGPGLKSHPPPKKCETIQITRMI